MKLTALSFVLLSACRVVAGTDDLFLCEADACPGGGNAGGGNAGGGDAGGNSGCADGLFAVEVTVVGAIVVEVDSTGEALTAGTRELCLPAGSDRLRASCTDESKASVSWGNDLCPDVDDSCDFTLSEDETFVVDGASACD